MQSARHTDCTFVISLPTVNKSLSHAYNTHTLHTFLSSLSKILSLSLRQTFWIWTQKLYSFSSSDHLNIYLNVLGSWTNLRRVNIGCLLVVYVSNSDGNVYVIRFGLRRHVCAYLRVCVACSRSRCHKYVLSRLNNISPGNISSNDLWQVLDETETQSWHNEGTYGCKLIYVLAPIPFL